MSDSSACPDDSHLSSEDYVFLREEIRHEDNLVNQRLSWLVSSQSFLLTGFAIAINSPFQSKFPDYERLTVVLVTLLPFAGVLTCGLSSLTIWAAVLHMKEIRRLAGNAHPVHLPPVHGTIWTRTLGLSGPLLTPFVFLTVWLILLAKR
jgi:hypothetical protein